MGANFCEELYKVTRSPEITFKFHGTIVVPFSRLILRGANFCAFHKSGVIRENVFPRKFFVILESNTWQKPSIIFRSLPFQSKVLDVSPSFPQAPKSISRPERESVSYYSHANHSSGEQRGWSRIEGEHWRTWQKEKALQEDQRWTESESRQVCCRTGKYCGCVQIQPRVRKPIEWKYGAIAEEDRKSVV